MDQETNDPIVGKDELWKIQLSVEDILNAHIERNWPYTGGEFVHFGNLKEALTKFIRELIEAERKKETGLGK